MQLSLPNILRPTNISAHKGYVMGTIKPYFCMVDGVFLTCLNTNSDCYYRIVLSLLA